MRRLLTALLVLYPPRHRREYGEEMLAVALDVWQRSGRTKPAAVRAVVDLVVGALGAWTDRLRRTAKGAGRGWGLDLRFVLRSLWGSRGYAATGIVVLACAVAAAATVFSFVRGTLLAEPPWAEPDRVMAVWGSNPEEGQLRDVISGPAYVEIQAGTSTFEHVTAFHHDAAYLLVDGRPEVMDAIEASVDFFRVLGIEPALGRLFGEEDRTSGAPATVVVTHAFWRDRLDGDPEAVGTRIPFEAEARTVIGVLPEGFEFVAPAPLFIPLRDDVLAADEPSRIHYNMLGLLAPGASVADASMDLGRAAARFTAVHAGFEGWTFLVEPLRDVTVSAVRPVIWTLAVTVSLVLLAALVNLATLFRIRILARTDELGVRVAVGAGWVRIGRVLALETVLVAAAGATSGLMATPWLLGRVVEILPQWIPIPESASRVPALHGSFDLAVAALAWGVAVFGALVLTAPSLATALRIDLASASRRIHRGVRGTRLLVGVEIAVATLLCVGAGLVARSADKLLAVDVGVEDEGLLTLYFGDAWGMTIEERAAYFRQTVDAVEGIPGVTRAGLVDYVDFQAEDDYARIYFLDRSFQPLRDVREEWRRVDGGLFDAAGMRIVAGRGFEAEDFRGKPRAAVVNRAFAARHWPGGSPLGAFVSTHDEHYRGMEVVGVVADVRSLGPAAPPPPMLYVPFQGNPRGTQGMYVDVAGDPSGYVERIRDAIWSVDASQPIAGIWPMSAFVDAWVAVPRATRSLVLSLAVLALFLSAMGVFGVVSYAVRTRRSELGVRLALGATPRRLERDQMRIMLPIVALGVAVGLAAGVTAARAARSLLYGIDPLDPASVAAAVVAMGSAALLAAWLPARRVGRIDPTETIRVE